MLLSNALLSYLLPTSLLHTTQHYSIPRPSSPSLRAPLEGRDPSRYLGAFTLPKSSSIRDEREQREPRGEAVKGDELGDSNDDDDAEDLELAWYYSAADEEELRQERELWKWLLTNDENGKISDLFKELLDDRPVERKGNRKDPLAGST
ncbi:hypothetical protein JCM3766R1_004538 [Sporobolomyces carnicolor]